MNKVKRNNSVHRLKERFIVLQDYAHLMLLTEIDTRCCVNEGVYSSLDKKCLNCDLKNECECLIDKSKTNIMEHDLHNVIKEMQVAKNYVERKSDHHIQEDGTCDCDPCSWLAEYNNTHSAALEIIRAEINDVIA